LNIRLPTQTPTRRPKDNNMVSQEERLKVLEMIAAGTLSVEDGAKLLESLAVPPKGPRPRPDLKDRRVLRVKVDDLHRNRTRVSVTLPMALVSAGLNIAGQFAGHFDDDHAQTLYDAMQSGQTGKIIDVLDNDDGEHVQVFIE
jgi:hypothetical protein